jgi:hypothetical protein
VKIGAARPRITARKRPKSGPETAFDDQNSLKRDYLTDALEGKFYEVYIEDAA